MSKKIDRAVNGPSWAEVILGATLSLVLGVVIGAILLIFKPVAAVKVMPKEADRDATAVYYIEGSRDGSHARQAEAKRKAFIGGQSVSVTEDDINSLVPAAAPTAAPKAAEKKETPAEKAKEKAGAAASELMTRGTPNFRIHDGTMQIGVPVSVSLLGLDQKVLVHARGGFVKEGDVFVYEPTDLYLGSCPVGRIPLVAGYARNKVLATEPIPQDIATAWRKLANVSIEGNTLKLAMP